MAKKYDVGAALIRHLEKKGEEKLLKEFNAFIGDIEENTSEENRIMANTFFSKKLLDVRAEKDINITDNLMSLANGHSDKAFVAGVKKKVLPLL